eukprot:scaffold8735_cov129-Isochrysis_galbana.AAC.9
MSDADNDSASAPSLPDCAQSRCQRQPSKEDILRIFAKTKNLPSTFPVGTSGYYRPTGGCDVPGCLRLLVVR